LNNYRTFSVVNGEQKTKKLSIFLLVSSFFPIAILFLLPELSFMRYYFYGALVTLFFIAVYLWKSKTTKQYQFLHNILKLLLLIGVLSLIFIDTSLLLEKVIDRLN